MFKYLISVVALMAYGDSALAAVNVGSIPLSLAAPADTSVLIDFESALPTGFTLSGGLVQNVSNSLGAEPAGDTSKYLSANFEDSAALEPDEVRFDHRDGADFGPA